ncbi:hypothetical protein UY3_07011 [Chelonia mydas]|uniref:Uncharacterized protein n=1 Tax=Chelonia mydas TaxID=8469 RepID=M7BF13_CHEMY|nr:hypothetical protein UY3_07011 [Chelonia mydas]
MATTLQFTVAALLSKVNKSPGSHAAGKEHAKISVKVRRFTFVVVLRIVMDIHINDLSKYLLQEPVTIQLKQYLLSRYRSRCTELCDAPQAALLEAMEQNNLQFMVTVTHHLDMGELQSIHRVKELNPSDKEQRIQM